MAAPAGARAVIAAPDRRRCLWSVLAAVLWFLTAGVSALEVYTPKEMYVANGTQGKLTCTFKSVNTTSMLTTVSWSFQPEGTDNSMSFFHYSQGQEYPGNYPPFKDRISWAGDLDKKDASISIENMQFIHNGTYICDVKNPPDIVAQPGHIRLYVVEKGPRHLRAARPLRRASQRQGQQVRVRGVRGHPEKLRQDPGRVPGKRQSHAGLWCGNVARHRLGPWTRTSTWRERRTGTEDMCEYSI
ncbi:myelin protein zero-like protein 1 isoform 2-T2 [Glossophaga mutica]